MMVQARTIIFGAGGHAKVVLEAARAARSDLDATVLDDNAPVGANLLGLAISGGRDWLARNWPEALIAPAIGQNRARASLIEWLTAQGRSLATIIHPSAVVSPTAAVGSGTFVAAGAVVNADAEIGEGVIINTAASVDHDCMIEPYAHVAPGARLCGGIFVGARSLIGTGAVLIPGVSVGSDAVIGAGSVVLRNVPAGARVAGCPAERI